MNIGTPGAGAVTDYSSCAPSRLLTVPSTWPAATRSPGRTAGSHQPSLAARNVMIRQPMGLVLRDSVARPPGRP